MNAFEFVFSLFGLLLGLSLAELMSGLVRTLKARKAVKLGLLTPLLAAFVMLDLTSFWANAWEVREQIPAVYGTLVLGLLASGLYYLAASLVFPERPEECQGLDDYFYRCRRQVLAGVAICNGAVILALVLAGSAAVLSGQALVVHGFYFTMMLLAALPARRWLNATALILLIALYAFFAIATLVAA